MPFVSRLNKRRRPPARAFLAVAGFFFLAVSFQNCGKSFQVSDSLVSAAAGAPADNSFIPASAGNSDGESGGGGQPVLPTPVPGAGQPVLPTAAPVASDYRLPTSILAGSCDVNIGTVAELRAMTSGGHYCLTNDIDLASAAPWSGLILNNFTFDGRGHALKNLPLTRGGFFSSATNGTVQNVIFADFSMQFEASSAKEVGVVFDFAHAVQLKNFTFATKQPVNFNSSPTTQSGSSRCGLVAGHFYGSVDGLSLIVPEAVGVCDVAAGFSASYLGGTSSAETEGMKNVTLNATLKFKSTSLMGIAPSTNLQDSSINVNLYGLGPVASGWQSIGGLFMTQAPTITNVKVNVLIDAINYMAVGGVMVRSAALVALDFEPVISGFSGQINFHLHGSALLASNQGGSYNVGGVAAMAGRLTVLSSALAVNLTLDSPALNSELNIGGILGLMDFAQANAKNYFRVENSTIKTVYQMKAPRAENTSLSSSITMSAGGVLGFIRGSGAFQTESDGFHVIGNKISTSMDVTSYGDSGLGPHHLAAVFGRLSTNDPGQITGNQIAFSIDAPASGFSVGALFSSSPGLTDATPVLTSVQSDGRLLSVPRP